MLQEGDRVGCLRKDNGTVHFFVNGVDQGPAASSVPADVYGVIDLYGQAAQATIVDNSGTECFLLFIKQILRNISHSRTVLFVQHFS